MKRMFLAVFLAATLAGCATMTPRQWDYVKSYPSSSVTVDAATRSATEPNIASFHGCLGMPLAYCLHGLFDRFDAADGKSLIEQMKRNDDVDVNGHPVVSSKTLTSVGSIHGLSDSGYTTVTIEYDDKRIVEKMKVGLPRDPLLAQTEQEYRDSGLFEAVSMILGDSCQSLDRTHLYKFFQNEIKPVVVNDGKTVDVSMNGASEDYMKHAAATYCGKLMTYRGVFGNDTEQITLDNPHGAYMSSTISFSPKNTSK